MELIRPFSVSSSALVSSNVPEVPPAAYNIATTYAAGDVVYGSFTSWLSLQDGNLGNTLTGGDWWRQLSAPSYANYSSGTTYALGEVVTSTLTHHDYESLVGSNLGNPLSDATKWLDLGPNNRWKMFDQSNTSATTRTEEIIVSVQTTGRADRVALLNISASTARVQCETVADGVIYDETVDLTSTSGIDNWYSWFFEPVIRRGDYVFNDLPPYSDAQITLTLSDPGNTVSIGTFVIGLSLELGQTLYGSRVGIQDYSKKEADAFGNYQIVQRAFAKRASFKVLVDNDKVDAISATLSQYRATPVVYIGHHDYGSTYIYGFYKDWATEIAYPLESYCNLELEGLT